MKWAMAVSISSILMLNVNVVCLSSDVKIQAFSTQTYSKEHKTIIAHMVSQDDLKGEALPIKGIVLKKSQHKDKNICIIEIISETYRGYTLIVQGKIKAKEGEKVEGFLYKDKFAPLGKLR